MLKPEHLGPVIDTAEVVALDITDVKRRSEQLLLALLEARMKREVRPTRHTPSALRQMRVNLIRLSSGESVNVESKVNPAAICEANISQRHDQRASTVQGDRADRRLAREDEIHRPDTSPFMRCADQIRCSRSAPPQLPSDPGEPPAIQEIAVVLRDLVIRGMQVILKGVADR